MKPRHRLAAAALALLAAAPAMAQSDPSQLGRLFATPSERAMLDGKRGVAPPPVQAGVASSDQPPALLASGVAPPPAALPQPVQLNGVLRSSDGRTTVWLDGAAQNDGAAKLLQDRQVQMRLSSGRRVILKPGQSYNPASGSVQELTTPAQPNQ
jgi:hypothetical protein